MHCFPLCHSSPSRRLLFSQNQRKQPLAGVACNSRPAQQASFSPLFPRHKHLRLQNWRPPSKSRGEIEFSLAERITRPQPRRTTCPARSSSHYNKRNHLPVPFVYHYSAASGWPVIQCGSRQHLTFRQTKCWRPILHLHLRIGRPFQILSTFLLLHLFCSAPRSSPNWLLFFSLLINVVLRAEGQRINLTATTRARPTPWTQCQTAS